MESIIRKVTAAGDRTQTWTAPDMSADGTELCEKLASELAGNLQSFTFTKIDDASYVDPLYSRCGYESLPTDSLARAAVVVVSGAAWAASGPQTVGAYERGDWEERRTSTGVVWWLSPGELPTARSAIEGNLVDISIDRSLVDDAEAEAQVSQLIEKYAETPPGS